MIKHPIFTPIKGGTLVLVARIGLILCIFGGFIIAVMTADRLNLKHGEPLDRVRIHAIPVAISQLYHGRPHDYTAYMSIARPFQGPGKTSELIERAIAHNIPENDATYFWTADDRGLSDYVYFSFSLFGPHISSLYYLWFLILFASLTASIVQFRDDFVALGVIGCTSLAIAAAIPMYVRAQGGNLDNLVVHISESRMLDILGSAALVHFLLTIVREVSFKKIWPLMILVFQGLVLIFIVHIRLSMAWMIVCIFIVVVYFLVFRSYRRQHGDIFGGVLASIGVMICLIGAFIVYQTTVPNPEYRETRGHRTLWHNVILGLATDRYFSSILSITDVDDQHAVRFVIDRMRENADPRLDEDWTVQNILNSLGGHTKFNWHTYENAAKEVVIGILFNHPYNTVRFYLWEKPVSAFRVVACHLLINRDACIILQLLGTDTREVLLGKWETYRSRIERFEIRLRPFRIQIVAPLILMIFTMLLAGIADRYRAKGARSELRPVMIVLGIGVLCGTIPSIVAYTAISQVGGMTVLLVAMLYAGCVFGGSAALSWIAERARG